LSGVIVPIPTKPPELTLILSVSEVLNIIAENITLNITGNVSIASDTLFVDNTSGRVGIGTTSPQNKLDVEGAAVIGATYSGTNTAPSNGLLVEGKVGIGTSSPNFVLDVAGPINASGLNITGNALIIGNVNITGRLDIGTLNISGVTFSQGDVDAQGSLRVSGGANISGDLGVSGTGDSYILGNVGIGTTSPSQELEVAGYINVTGTSTSNSTFNGDVRIIGTLYGASPLKIGGGVNISGVPSGQDAFFVSDGTGAKIFRITDKGELNITSSAGNTSFDEKTLFIDAENNLIGIGKTSPGATLQVSGDAQVSGVLGSGKSLSTQQNARVGTNLVVEGTLAVGQNSLPLDTGTGNDGNISISGTLTIDTDAMASGRTSADAVNFAVTTNSSKGSVTIDLGATPTGLAVGDEILIINIRDPDNADSSLYSDWDTNINEIKVGQHETHYITAISGNELTLDTPLKHEYRGFNYSIMVQRVPHYTNVSIMSGGSLIVSAFSTSTNKGGILFFRATGLVNVTGSISANAKGYKGGSDSDNDNTPGGVTYNGIGGTGSEGGGGDGGTGQGGGGGGGSCSCTDTGGTGTAGGAGGGGGQGNGGGGGSGYGTVGTGGKNAQGSSQDGSSGSGNSGGNGGTTSSSGQTGSGGGGGGTYGDAALTRLMLGSGGGSSASDGSAGSPTGGTGGGIVYISASNITVSGSINASGGDGTATATSKNAGGASGGSIYLKASTMTLGSSLVTVYGGLGPIGGGGGGSGGDGGVGRIRIDVGSSTGSTSPASYGDGTTATLFATRSDTGDIFALDYNGSIKFLVESSGNVGIGTNTPTELLTVVGGNVNISGSSNPIIQYIETTGSGSSARLQTVIPVSGTGQAEVYFYQGDGQGAANNMGYALGYHGNDGNFRLRSHDSDGAGADADIFRVPDGGVDVNGNGNFVDTQFGPSEWVIGHGEEGDVVCTVGSKIDEDGVKRVEAKPCDTANSTLVLGVVTPEDMTPHHGNPNFDYLDYLAEEFNITGAKWRDHWQKTHMGIELTGFREVKVIGSVKIGDLLVSSNIAGYAISAENPDVGTVIGKALENFDGEKGMILARVHLQ